MLFFFDTEFYDDGKTIDFISIGIVSGDNRTYYAVSNEFDETKIDDWVRKNVISQLPSRDQWKSKKQIAAEVKKFVGKKPKFWVYNGAYDWVALCQLFGTMRDLPKTFPWFANDIKQYWYSLKNPELPEQKEAGKHDALVDALWTKEVYEFLSEYEKSGS